MSDDPMKYYEEEIEMHIPVGKLEDDHLLKCIAFCERREQMNLPVFRYLIEERDRRENEEVDRG